MTATGNREERRDGGPPGERDLPAPALRRITELEALIAHHRDASAQLSAQGMPTAEVDRIIDILVSSLQLVRDYNAVIAQRRNEVRMPVGQAG